MISKINSNKIKKNKKFKQKINNKYNKKYKTETKSRINEICTFTVSHLQHLLFKWLIEKFFLFFIN